MAVEDVMDLVHTTQRMVAAVGPVDIQIPHIILQYIKEKY